MPTDTRPSEDPRPNMRMPDTDDFPRGPEVGDELPDFTLLNQAGEKVNFTEARAGRKAMVVFHRSARW